MLCFAEIGLSALLTAKPMQWCTGEGVLTTIDSAFSAVVTKKIFFRCEGLMGGGLDMGAVYMRRSSKLARAQSWFRLTSLIILAFCFIPHTVLAETITWEFHGLVLLNRGFINWPLQANDEVRVFVTFDNTGSFFTLPSSNNRPGYRYEYNYVPSLQFEIYGGGCNPCKPVSDASFNRIFVRDSFANPQYNSGSDLALDGITFQINSSPANGNATIGLFLRDTANKYSPEIISVTGNQPLPTTPDSRITQMTTRHLQISNETDLVNIELDTVRVKPAVLPNRLDSGSGTLNIPTVRVGNTTYQNVALQLIDPIQLIFRLTGGIPMNPANIATAWFDQVLGILNIPQVTVGAQTYSSVSLSLTDPVSMEFAVTGGTLIDSAIPPNQIRMRGLVSLSRGVVNQGNVIVRCGSGDTAVFPLSYDGWFDDFLVTQQTDPFPCMLRVEAATPTVSLYSYVTEPDTQISISPLSSLVLTKALYANPAATFAAFGQSIKDLDDTVADLNDAPQFVVAALEAISGYRMINYSDQSTPNVFIVKSSDDMIDRSLLLKAVDVALNAAASNYIELHALVAQEAGLRESFDRKIYDTVAGMFTPEVTGVNCMLVSGSPGPSLSCTVTGRNLGYPGFIDGRVSDIGITVARAALAQTKTDPDMPFKPSWCSRAAGEIGSLFVSTDGTDLDGADPLEMFAEEIQFPPCGPAITFEDNLWVEVTKNNLDFQGPPGWPLLSKPHKVVSVSGSSNPGGGGGGGGGNSGTNSVSIASASCTSVASDFFDHDDTTKISSAPVIQLSGAFTKQSNYVLEVVVSKGSVSDALLAGALFNWADTTDGVFLLHELVCNNAPAVGCILDSAGTYVVEPDTSIPDWVGLQMFTGWPELGIARGNSASLQVHAFIHDFSTVVARQTVTVNCPAPH